MAQMSTGFGRHEKRARPSPLVAPLAVPPSEAARMLSIGISRLYRLLRTGELASYRDGRSRRVVVASIHEHVARQLAADPAGWRQIHPRPQERRRRASSA
jgi:excisionase family DNA binding protein